MNRAEVILALARREQGNTGVVCRSGRIDVLTASQVIQVERIQHWRVALGSAMRMANEMPGCSPRIHLIGSQASPMAGEIKDTAAGYGVALTWEEES